MLLDLTPGVILGNTYDGVGQKIPVVFNNQKYLLKFTSPLEPDSQKPLQASYQNVPICEHLGSSIFNLLGIPAQKTLLAIFQNQMVVACKDFIHEQGINEYTLIEFKKLETSFLGGSKVGGRVPEFNQLSTVMNQHPLLTPIKDKAFYNYYQIFIGDALIGNFDRHAGNWGYIYDQRKNLLIDTAPVYDCGSSLYPQLSPEAMADILTAPSTLEQRILTYPTATLRINNKKIPYHEFLLAPIGKECRSVLLDLFPQIHIPSIHSLIFNTEGMRDVQRDFYSTLITQRYNLILVPAYEMALQEQKGRNADRQPLLSGPCPRNSTQLVPMETREQAEKQLGALAAEIQALTDELNSLKNKNQMLTSAISQDEKQLQSLSDALNTLPNDDEINQAFANAFSNVSITRNIQMETQKRLPPKYKKKEATGELTTVPTTWGFFDGARTKIAVLEYITARKNAYQAAKELKSVTRLKENAELVRKANPGLISSLEGSIASNHSLQTSLETDTRLISQKLTVTLTEYNKASDLADTLFPERIQERLKKNNSGHSPKMTM